MKRKGEYSVSKRTVRAFIIMAIILIPISFGMILAGMQLTRDRESAQNELKMNVLARLVANENDMLDAAKEQFDRNLSAHMRMMTASLKAFVTGDGYTGPRVLPDGFVVELRGDKVILPDGAPEGRMNITRELIEESLESGGMRTGRLYADAEAVGDASPSSGADGGVKLPASDSGTKHGALILALMPEQVRQAADLNRFDEQSTVFATNGTRCFIADANTGVILHDSDASMVGLTVEECGLSEKSLQDGYMDFDVVNGTRCFVVTSKYDGSIYYYARESRRMFDNVLVFGIASTLLFALATAIILFYVLVGYSEAVYAECAVVSMPAEMLGLARKHDAQAQKKTERAARAEEIRKRTGGWIKTLLDRLSGMIHWNERLPEEKTSFVFKVSLLTLVISWTNLLFSKNMIYNKFDSLAGFLLKGDWMRGANLFSFCSILLIIAYAILINLISRAILFILSGFLLGKGQTLCRLLHSFVKYFSLFVVLYLILNYLGFPIGTVVGSLSITTLALSFGAKDLAADILAGLSIVFERTFKVGDIVEIKGNRGMVQEIGVRSTKLVILPANNVLVISNHEISDVLNLTQDVSMHTLEIRIVAPESLERLEEMLNREMPLIQQKNDRVISLRYLGVTALGSGNSTGNPSIITLGIAAYCQEADVDDVMLFVNREMRLLSEREGFTIV